MIASSPPEIAVRPMPAVARRGPAESSPRSGPPPLSFGVLIASMLAAGGVNFVVIWNHFYAGVPFLFDTGWYAALVHRVGPIIANPASVAFATIGPQFYATHLSPFLWVLSLPTQVIPVGPVVWLACVEAAKHLLIAVLGWGLLRAVLASDNGAAPTGTSRAARTPAVIAAVLLPFNGLLLAGVAYPHFELWFLPPALAFFWALFRGRHGLAAAAFVAALLVREDIGFHLCGVLVIATAGKLILTRTWEPRLRVWLAFAAAGFAASVAALLVMTFQFPGDSAFARVYTGEPAYAHLTPAALGDRLGVILRERGHLWMPAFVYIVWAVTRRAGWVLIGYAAFVPWFLFNVTAVSLAPGTLSLYYVFPFALALLWPLVGALAFTGPEIRAQVPVGVAAGVVASILGFAVQADFNDLGRRLALPDPAAAARLEQTVGHLASARAAGRSVLVDDAVAAHDATRFAADNLAGQHPGSPAIAAYYATGRATKAMWEATLDLPYHYTLRGFPLIVAAATPLDWPALIPTSRKRGSIEALLRRDRVTLGWDRDPSPADLPRIVTAGPGGWYLPPGGRWVARFALTVEAGSGAVFCEVLADGAVIASSLVSLAADKPATLERAVPFAVPEPVWADIGVRVRVRGDLAGQVVDVAIQPEEGPLP